LKTFPDDRNLNVYGFKCAGSNAGSKPERKGGVVGLQAWFVILYGYIEDRHIVDDHEDISYKGCKRYITNSEKRSGICEIGGGPCPVNSVVNFETFNWRVEEIRKFKRMI